MIGKLVMAIQEYDGWSHTTPAPQTDMTPFFIIAGIAIIAIIICGSWAIKKIYDADKTTQKNRSEQYRLTLDGLNKQLTEGKISEEKYAELLTKLEERHKRRWYE